MAWGWPRVMALEGITKLCAAMACSTVRMAGSSLTLTLARLAASRAYSMSRATTTATGWPKTAPCRRPKWVVVHDGAAVVFAGYVARGVHRHHTVHAQHLGAVNALANKLAVRHGRGNERGVQRALQLGQVVGIRGVAADCSAADSCGSCWPYNAAWLSAVTGVGRSWVSPPALLEVAAGAQAQHQVTRHQGAVSPGGAQAVARHKAAGNGAVDFVGLHRFRDLPSSTASMAVARHGEGAKPL